MSLLQVNYIDHMGSDLRVVNSARYSFGANSQQLEDRDKKLIKYLAEHEHMSPFEHNILTVIIECPLYIRSQIHRHRTFSYNEISRRYTSEDLTFFIPEVIRKQAKSNRQASEGELDEAESTEALHIFNTIHQDALNKYARLIELGVSREQARGILPQNLMTKFYMTGNLRNWAHFIKLRIDHHAQHEVREIGARVLTILQDKFPVATSALLGSSDSF